MKQESVILASEVQPGDYVESWFNPSAARRRPAGWRVGDRETFGRFVGFRNFPEGFTAKAVEPHAERPNVTVLTALNGATAKLYNNTKVTVWR